MTHDDQRLPQAYVLYYYGHVVKHQNLIVIITILLLAVVILLAKTEKHAGVVSKHYPMATPGTCITVAYGTHLNEGANLLDLYLPEHASILSTNSKQKYPLIVFIHGGAWQSGDKSMLPNPEEFVRHGYVLASINYRLVKEAPHPAQIEDCKAAVNWLRAHAKIFKIDPNRIGLWGNSAGGHLAALMGTTGDITSPQWAAPGGVPCHIQAVCDWCGPTDLTTINMQAGAHNSLAEAVQLFLQGTPLENPSLAREASPVTYVHKGLPPFLIMHGDKDNVVPVEQSKELAKALKAAQVNCNFQVIPGAGHMFGSPNTIAEVVRFFDKVLK